MLKAILAVDQGNAIGWDNGRLAWHLPEDLKRFKALTEGGTVVMGYSTFKSLNRKNGLPNRNNIVLTSKPYSEIRGQFGDDVSVISSLEYILARADSQDFWIIGGASVYNQVLTQGHLSKIYLTLVHDISGANVVLQDDMYSWKLFVLQQRAKGINWDVELQVPATIPETSYITLTKI